MEQVQKAIEISDAKIQFISLVDKAANKRQFLVTKAQNGTAQFSTVGKILKIDDATHYITGIVYEPLVEDTHGNFMTEDEIRKSAHWFAKNGKQVDLQHSFEAVEGVNVVENYIAPCDMKIGDTLVVKGTWIITAEVMNAGVWNAIQKGQITGFSMGGFGQYSEEEVNLKDIEKTDTFTADATTEKKGLLKKLASLFGLDVVEKGALVDSYKERAQCSNFWNAFYALEDLLYRYNWTTDRYEFEENESSIQEALMDFSNIMIAVLSDDGEVMRELATAAPINKAGKKLSSANQQKLDGILGELKSFRAELLNEEEPTDKNQKEKTEVTKQDVQEMIDTSIEKSREATMATPPPTAAPAQATEAASTQEDIAQMIEEAITKALNPILQARGLSSNLNDEKTVCKSGEHYLHGIL